MKDKIDLSSISTEDLLDELRKRPNHAMSVWDKEDVHHMIEEHLADWDGDPNARPELTEKQIDAIAAAFLMQVADRLEDIVRERGNDYLWDRWVERVDDLIKPYVKNSAGPGMG